mmetsp:Transcript_17557/g.32906  ORF Transcript_17557/g.32906 Transcript_17557/m.32906 type:complete len:87 (-) Transcript_17557:434-694(-)
MCATNINMYHFFLHDQASIIIRQMREIMPNQNTGDSEILNDLKSESRSTIDDKSSSELEKSFSFEPSRSSSPPVVVLSTTLCCLRC